MDGVLVIDKPAGPTSFDVVERVRSILGEPKAGHTGTLDPMATGVLPLVLGRATRLARFLSGADKEYEAGIRLGRATDTYDATGRDVPVPGTPRVASPADPGPAVIPAPDEVEAALATFRGTYEQAPPPFSAKKIEGVRAYELARRGDAVQPRRTLVTVSDLRLLAAEGSLVTLRITCSAGFYVRSLAHDLGLRLGVGGHLETLRRTRSGDFDAAGAAPLSAIEQERALALERLVPMDRLLPSLPRADLNERGARRVVHGEEIAPADLNGLPPDTRGPVRLVDAAGRLVAIGMAAGRPGFLHPAVVLK